MRLLIVDVNRDFRESAGGQLRRLGHDVRAEAEPNAAAAALRDGTVEVVLLDATGLPMTAGELIGQFKDVSPDCEVVMITSDTAAATRRTAVRDGAFDCVRKTNAIEDLEPVLQGAGERRRFRHENRQLREAIVRTAPSSEIIGTSAEMQQVLSLIDRVGPTDSPVLILGESGTGKELVARAVHGASRRSSHPMVTINCAALQETLLESELFGHEKGAFTGAVASKPGLFEVADGGTLFIDEVGELAPALQAKLLRVLEDGHMRRVGATREQQVDVRILAATNRNLFQDVSAGRFREDLFFRINVVPLELPPLRDRRADIPLLANHFLRTACRDWNFTDEAMEWLMRYSWPGNVRELHNVIERATILADSNQITLAELPPQLSRKLTSAEALPNTTDVDNLEEREKQHVQRVLERENWNRNRTAEALGVNRRSLYRLIQKYGLRPGIESDSAEE